MLTAVILWLLVAAALAFAYYSHCLEPRRLGTRRLRPGIPRLSRELEGLKILHLADLHLKGEGSFQDAMGRLAVQRALEEQPDIICLTGDLGNASRFVSEAVEVLGPLAGPTTLVVMGNHDHDKMLETDYCGPVDGRVPADEWRRVIEDAGLRVLHNDCLELQVRGRRVIIAGCGDPSCGWDDLPRTLRGDLRGDLHLLLVHSPDMVDDPATDWADLILCGHTHGGQFRLPGLGSPWAPVWRDRRRSDGLLRFGSALCHVTRGVAAGVRTRFLCPPEIVCLSLTAGEGDWARELPRFPEALAAPAATAAMAESETT
jgi:hypothetical protein